MKRVLLLALLLLALPSCAGEPGQLYRRSFDADWKFFKGDDPAYSEAAFDDASWRSLDLPHDWGVEGPFVQSYPGETGYSKGTKKIPPDYSLGPLISWR